MGLRRSVFGSSSFSISVFQQGAVKTTKTRAGRELKFHFTTNLQFPKFVPVPCWNKKKKPHPKTFPLFCPMELRACPLLDGKGQIFSSGLPGSDCMVHPSLQELFIAHIADTDTSLRNTLVSAEQLCFAKRVESQTFQASLVKTSKIQPGRRPHLQAPMPKTWGEEPPLQIPKTLASLKTTSISHFHENILL